jgi:glycosyltransferase involved in cell wall biosynthesis
MRLEGEDVRIVGRVADVSKVYAGCDVVFVPSREESFCRVAAEGLANGKFVAASDLEPLRELSALGDTVSLFPVGDVDGAVSCLRAIGALSQDQRRDRGAYVAGRTREAFSLESVAGKLEALYDRASAKVDRSKTA